MYKPKVISLLVGLIIISILTNTTALVVAQSPVHDLYFNADIYGDEGLETVTYTADLAFQNWGGYGINAHVFRAFLTGGDQIALGISQSASEVFSLDISDDQGVASTLIVDPQAYSQGTTSNPTDASLQTTWELNQGGYQIQLIRDCTLEPNPDILGQYMVRETFSIRNLGKSFYINRFSESYHNDDLAEAGDFNYDGKVETLLVINNYSTHGFPVFGKIYSIADNTSIIMGIQASGYVIVNHYLNYTAPGGKRTNLSEARMITALVKDGLQAKRQVEKDAYFLLRRTIQPETLAVRSYNTDDFSAVFVNGLLALGTSYSEYSDSSWQTLNSLIRVENDSHLTFADVNTGGPSSWGFLLNRGDTNVFQNVQSGPSSLGYVYTHFLKVTPDYRVTDFTPPTPSHVIAGSWNMVTQVSGGIGYGLVGDRPLATSANNQENRVDISSYLGHEDNHIHFNAWSPGGRAQSIRFAIEKNGVIAWEHTLELATTYLGRTAYIHLVIDKDGNIYPKFNFPVDYRGRSSGTLTTFNTAFGSRITSFFDHKSPDYNQDGWLLPYTGTQLPNPGGITDCTIRINCYDGHPGYDIGHYCYDDCDNELAIYPVADGVIVPTETGWNNELGCLITLDHGAGWQTRYAHLVDTLSVGGQHLCPGIVRKTGVVSQYEQIGIMGHSGLGGYGPENVHLHFETTYNSNVSDPSGWIADPQVKPDPWAGHAVSYPLWAYINHSTQLVNAAVGGQLTTPDQRMTITIPTGVLSENAQFSVVSYPVLNTEGGLINFGYSFDLSAVSQSGQVLHTLGGNIQIQIHFDSLSISNHTTALTIYKFDFNAGQWVPLSTSVDLLAGTATAHTNHLSIFALMGQNSHEIYLPLTMSR